MMKKFKKSSAMILSVMTAMSLSMMSMPVSAENENSGLIKDWDEYMDNLTDQEYEKNYGDLCDEELFYTCMGVEYSFVDENGNPFENLEVTFIERVDGGNDKYKVIESWNTSDEPVKKILLEDMMTDNDARYYSYIVSNIPEGYICEDMEELKEFMAMPKDEQPTEWIYCITDVMSVSQTKMDNTRAGIFNVEKYYQPHKIEVIPESLYKQRQEEFLNRPVSNVIPGILKMPIVKTVSGDANEDGEVNISDAVLIMQSIANPEEFALTEQGRANADIYGDGDGVTLMDALTIQEMSLNKSNA